MEAWLETATGDRVPVQGSFSIGRASQNTLVLPGDPRVSRRHALIHQQGAGEFWLVDLGSSNGVLRNGRRVRQPEQLQDQDRIEIGSFLFVFGKQEAPPLSGVAETTVTKTTNFLTIKETRTEELWLLIADIEGFTPLSQKLPGDELAKLVGRWICSCKEIIESQEGIINKYLGDGFLAYWPSSETPPAKIAGAVAELQKLQGRQQFPFRLVLHRGKITVDNAVALGENSLIGPDVNFIFRLEKVAGKLGQPCLLSKTAAGLLAGFGRTVSVGEHPVAGFGGHHEFFSYESAPAPGDPAPPAS